MSHHRLGCDAMLMPFSWAFQSHPKWKTNQPTCILTAMDREFSSLSSSLRTTSFFSVRLHSLWRREKKELVAWLTRCERSSMTRSGTAEPSQSSLQKWTIAVSIQRKQLGHWQNLPRSLHLQLNYNLKGNFDVAQLFTPPFTDNLEVSHFLLVHASFDSLLIYDSLNQDGMEWNFRSVLLSSLSKDIHQWC